MFSPSVLPHIASPQPPLSEIPTIITNLFSLTRIPFVRDFIFTPDFVADISILTAPVQNEHAIAAHISVTGTEKPPSVAPGFTKDVYFCSIPAFSVGFITVGFVIIEPRNDHQVSGYNVFGGGGGRVQCNRYVRDDENGVFLMVAHNESTGLTEFDCVSHKSSRKRMRVCARFYTKSLHTHLSTCNGVDNADGLLQVLSYLSVAYETRACPMCKLHGVGDCFCVLPFRRPAHPLDFRNEVSNMRLHTGLYEGESTVRLFSKGVGCLVADLDIRSVIKGSLDRSVINRLSKYAIQDRMSRLRVTPLMEVGGGDGKDCGGRECYRGEDEGVIGGSFVEGFLQEPWGNAMPTMNPFGGGGVTAGVSMDAKTFFEGSDNSQGTVLSLKGEHGSGMKLGSRRNENVVDIEMNMDGRKNVEEDSDEKGNASTSGRTEGCGGVVEGMVDKAERRKVRNREAAAKSNVKRKIRNDNLRRDLKEISDRAYELRELEKKLRVENVRLRGLATQRKFKVSEHLTHIQISRLPGS